MDISQYLPYILFGVVLTIAFYVVARLAARDEIDDQKQKGKIR